MDWNNFYVSSLGHLNANSNPASVVNLFKLSKDHTPQDQTQSPKSDEVTEWKHTNLLQTHRDSSLFVNYQKDLQLWDRDKSAVIDIVTKRLRNLDDARSRAKKPSVGRLASEDARAPNASDEPDVVMSTESEILLSWLDKYFYDNEKVTEEAHRVFVENAASLLTKVGLNPMNFLNFLIDIGKLATPKSPNFLQRYLRVALNHLHRHAWGSLHISLLNFKGVLMDSLTPSDNASPQELLKTLVECANVVYPGQPSCSDQEPPLRSPDYYFFLAYLLFRSGSAHGLGALLRERDDNLRTLGLDHTQFPPLFAELCEILRDVLLEKPNEARHLLLDRFSTEYFAAEVTHGNVLAKGSNYYALLLLSMVYPDYYPQVDASTLPTKEDYLWYQIHIILAGSGTNLVHSAYRLCHSLTHEVNDITASDSDLVERIFAYAYSIALAGGLMESLRLLMSAVKVPAVQVFAVFFVVYFENCRLFEFDELKYIAHTLWNLSESPSNTPEDLSYLVQLAFNRKRKVSSELKILLSTMLPAPKNMVAVKYAVSDNFNAAVNPCFVGSSVTRNGMLLVGPLLQKLIKLSMRRNAAKYAILLLAQYSAHVGLWAVAFKCFYCIHDVENSASVLEACCCYLYDNREPDAAKSFTVEDLAVYYTLVKNLAPNNKHVLELRNVFNCVQLCVLVNNGEHDAAVTHCKKTKLFENALHVLRNESHQIYFNALFSYIKALRHLVSTGRQPSELLDSVEANNLVDLVETAYNNPKTDRNATMDALHMLLTFISIVPPK